MFHEFKKEKTTQIAGLLLSLHGGEMTLLKLIKLLYLVDREALDRWGRPITYDSYVSMDNGPVLSNTYNLIKGTRETSYWDDFISERGLENQLALIPETPPVDRLAEAEFALVQEVFRKHGKKSAPALVDLCHQFEEWQHPSGSAIPIELVDILRALGKPEDDANEIAEELEAVSFARRVLE